MKAPKLAASAAASRSASASTTSRLAAELEQAGVRCSAHFSAMILPTRVEPVKSPPPAAVGDQLVDHVGRVAGCVMIRLTAPAGSPASTS